MEVSGAELDSGQGQICGQKLSNCLWASLVNASGAAKGEDKRPKKPEPKLGHSESFMA